MVAGFKDKLTNQSPLQLLDKKYVSWQEGAARAALVAPLPTHAKPPSMREGRLAWQAGGVVDSTAADAHVMHLATIPFSAKSIVCEPIVDKVLKLADELLTVCFVTDTELSFSTSLRRTWSSRAWKASRNGARWLMGLHLSTHSMCAITSPQHA